MIKSVIFDLGRTLVPFSFDPLASRLDSCREEAERLFMQAEVGQLQPDEFRAGICGLTGLPANDFVPWWNSIFAREWLVPPAWIRALRQRYRLGLLSNTNAHHFAFLMAEWPILAEFDFHILSHIVGAAKPSPAIYAAAEAQAQCPPQAILYFDDVPEFVEAARRRRWNAVQFRSARDVAAALPDLPPLPAAG